MTINKAIEKLEKTNSLLLSVEEKIAEICWENCTYDHAMLQAQAILALIVEGWVVESIHYITDIGGVEETHPATLRDILDGKAVKG